MNCKHLKRCSTLLVIKEMQIEMTMGCHIPLRQWRQGVEMPDVGRGVREWGEFKLVQTSQGQLHSMYQHLKSTRPIFINFPTGWCLGN